MPLVDDFVQPLKERDRREIFTAAEFVGNPFAFAPRVIEIEHGSHRIHAQPVNVIFVQPENSIRNQEILHFVAAVVEDQGTPIRMLALSRIGMLVKMRAVELSESVRVVREMRGSPVQENSNARLVKPVQEVQ